MNPELQKRAIGQMQAVAELNVAFVGVATGAIDALAEGPMDLGGLASAIGGDEAYVRRWLDAAYASLLVERVGDPPWFELSDLGRAYASGTPGTLMPFAVQAVLGAHMAERAATLTASGERPGESVLAERPSILPLFGPMLEHSFGPLFERVVSEAVPIFGEVDAAGGLAIDLGCGNGWYLRKLAKRYPHLRGIGLDGFATNVAQASALAEAEGLGDRLRFSEGDIHHFTVDEPASLIAMNRALHHVWAERDNVFRILREHLAPGGAAVIWEPVWPADPSELRSHPRYRGIAFQNLSEHVQGNHFLRPEEIAEGLEEAGLTATIYRLVEGTEAVVVGRR